MQKHHYQTTLILAPDLEEKRRQEIIQKFRKLLKELQARLVHDESIGMRALAYPIQKHRQGFYHHIQFEGPTDAITRLESQYKLIEPIIRFLTVRLDKHGVAYYEQQRQQAQKLAQSAKSAASDVKRKTSDTTRTTSEPAAPSTAPRTP